MENKNVRTIGVLTSGGDAPTSAAARWTRCAAGRSKPIARRW